MSRYSLSESQLIRAEKTIPLGSQTFSKSRTQYPVGISPLYAARAKGARIWDIDGNCYIDLVNSLAAVTLGYGDSKLNKSIRKQLRSGVSLSLPGKLEAEVAEMIVDLVPSAEMVRFGKNGTDATSAAVRLARAYTGRDHIVVCGYHGWQDWYIGSTTRNKGVPNQVSALTHQFEYNNIESLESIFKQFNNEIAAVIMEPMNSSFPDSGFLEDVLSKSHAAGALLIFDETITGFRFAKGGAQELFSVTPDISTFGKGIANGFPLSAVVGRREIMLEMEEIFFSGTFGGELLSLAAAKNVLERHLDNDVCENLAISGTNLANLTKKAIYESGLQNVLSLSGHPTWQFLKWNRSGAASEDEVKTYFMQEVFKRGLLVLSTHNISLAHTEKVLSKISDIYQSVFHQIRHEIDNETLRDNLDVDAIKPLFKVR